MAEKPEVIVARCLRDFEEDEIVHRTFVTKVRQRYDAYRGVLEIGSEGQPGLHGRRRSTSCR